MENCKKRREGFSRKRDSESSLQSLVSRTVSIAKAYSDVDLDRTERVLEEEIRRESCVPSPEHRVARVRHNGKLLLHSKQVLLAIVVLNLIDCALVLGELMLDIHYIKELREHSEMSSQNFIDKMESRYSDNVYGNDIEHMNVLYDQLYRADCVWQFTDGKRAGTDNVVTQSNDNMAARHKRYANLDHETRNNKSEFSQNSSSISDTTRQEYKHFRNRTFDGNYTSSVNNSVLYTGDKKLKYHHQHSVWEEIAHGMHKASIIILGILCVESILKACCMGREFFSKKLEVFDTLIVIISFIIDLVFVKGLSGYKVQDALMILSFLLPWRVIRVVNSLIVAVLDHEHFRLKMLYQEKKVIASQLKVLKELEKKWDFHLQKIEQFCESEGIPKWKIRQHTAMGRKQSTITSMASLALNGVFAQIMTSPKDYALLTKSLSLQTQDSVRTNLTSIDEDSICDDGNTGDHMERQSSATESELEYNASIANATKADVTTKDTLPEVIVSSACENNNSGSEVLLPTRSSDKGLKRVSFDECENRPLLTRQRSVDEQPLNDIDTIYKGSRSCVDFMNYKCDHAHV